MGPDNETGFEEAINDILYMIKAYKINPGLLMHYANLIIAKKKEEDLKRKESPEKGG